MLTFSLPSSELPNSGYDDDDDDDDDDHDDDDNDDSGGSVSDAVNEATMMITTKKCK